MATEVQIQSIERIMRLALQISLQCEHHIFASYSGHINKFEVYAHPFDCDYGSYDQPYSPGLESGRYWIDLHNENGELDVLEQTLRALLELDEDGIPV